MTFNPVAAQNIIQCKNIIKQPKPTAVDLGSQTPSLNNTFLDFILKKNQFLVSSQKLMISDLKKNKYFSTYDFFKSVGYNDYC